MEKLWRWGQLSFSRFSSQHRNYRNDIIYRMNPSMNKATANLLLFLISFFLYSPSLRNDFVWDDIEVIQKSYHSFKASRISSIFFPEAKQNRIQRYYRPIIFVSMVLDRWLWGINSFGFHLSNLLLILFHRAALRGLSDACRIGVLDSGKDGYSLRYLLHTCIDPSYRIISHDLASDTDGTQLFPVPTFERSRIVVPGRGDFVRPLGPADKGSIQRITLRSIHLACHTLFLLAGMDFL
jgi:hypothetical protein